MGTLQRINRRTNLCWRLTAPFLRLGAFVLVVTTVVSLLSMRRAGAQLDETMLRLGDGLMEYAHARHQDEPRGLVLNGQRLYLRSGTTDDDVDTVLDHYQAVCRTRDGHLLEQLLSNPELDRLPEVMDTSILEPTRRFESGDVGYVVCLDTGSEEPLGLAELTERVDEFVRTGDLSAVGELRYAFARRSRERTHFMVFWTRGPFNVREMFPEEGDAPGRDVDGIPRPPGGRRILSSWEDGFSYSVTMYSGSPMRAPELEAHYRAALADGLFVAVDPPARFRQHARTDAFGRTLTVEGDGRMITLVFTEDEGAGGVTTVLESAWPLEEAP